MAWKSVPKANHLYRRGAKFYVKRRVPAKLRTQIGREFFVQALGTSDEREARRLAHIANTDIQRRIDEATGRTADRQVNNIRLDDVDLGFIEDVVSRWFASGYRAAALAFLDDDENEQPHSVQERRTKLTRDAALLSIPSHPSHENVLRPVLAHLVRSEGFEHRYREVGGITLKAYPEIVADRTGTKYRFLTDMLRRGMLELINQELAQLALASHAIADPDMRAAIDGTRAKRRVRVNELMEEFLKDPGRAQSGAKVKLDYGFVFRIVAEVVGYDRRIDEISRDDIKEVRTLLNKIPANATKLYPNLTLAQASEAAASEGRNLLSQTTIKGHLHKISSLFKFAVDEEYLDRNPARALAPKRVTHTSSDRLPFSDDQLQKIFSAPIFQGCLDGERGWSKPGSVRHRGARYWIPIIGLLHGMRLNEICQLHTTDVGTDGGIAHFKVQTLDEEEDGRRAKTEAAKRSIPLHSLIVELGFLDFWEKGLASGNARLFPELSLDARGYYSDGFQKWFSRLLVNQGAKKARTSFHSFRHLWRQALREANVQGERVRIIGGWREADTSEMYGYELSLREAKLEIEKVQFPVVSQLLLSAG